MILDLGSLLGLTNALLATGLLFPMISRDLLDLQLPYPGDLMVSGFLYFTAIILIYCSRDVEKFATIIYYEGILRIAEASIMFHAAFWGDAGYMFAMAAAGDLAIGLTYLVQLNRHTGSSHGQLLLAR